MANKPEEIEKQLRSSKKRRGLKSSQETIDIIMQENLALKLEIRNLKENLKKLNFDETNQDVLAQLMARNEQLEQQLEEKEKESERPKEKKDIECQTNLDLMNVEELIKVSVEVKNQERMKAGTALKNFNQTTKTPVNNRPMSDDEKEILELLYRLSGNMTTTLNKMRAKALDIPHPKHSLNRLVE